ncbi:MAG TPA: family 78 glycoside hydrolase catalytic domain [Microlunatus sp.]
MPDAMPDLLADAQMIASDDDFSGAPLLRTSFVLDTGHGPVASAALVATALGVVELEINGQSVAADVLTPGWSSYEWRLRYRSYDVAELLPEPGQTAVLGASLGNGWYRGRLGFNGKNAFYGDELGLLARLDLTYADGHLQTVLTDRSWRSAPSGITRNDIYDGQTIDARERITGWSSPELDSSGWAGVHQLEFDHGRLTAPIGPPVVRHEVIKPVRVFSSPSGRTLIDFGQNLVGWLRFSVSGPAGRQIEIKHAEVLEGGELCTRILRSAEQTDRFVLSGGDDFFEPTKTFHGFRYVQVDGWPGDLDPDALEAVVVSSDLPRTGTFTCSNDLVNQLHNNVVWGQRSNFVDVPTDCPQRDERLGWTGDLAAFAPTAAFLFDVSGFLGDWLQDLWVEQRAAGGRVPYVAPDLIKFDPGPPEIEHGQSVTAIWGDAAVWVPWTLYQAYGDRRLLERQYDSMAAHVQSIEKLLSDDGVWDSGFQFADWLDPDAPEGDSAAAKADKGVVATACAYRSTDLVARTAQLLGNTADHDHFRTLADELRSAFNRAYLDDRGVITSDCATVYALAIHFGLLDDADLARAGNRLAELVAAAGYRVSTGFAGTPFVTWALSRTGHLDAAYRLLLEQECPSWLYPVTMGATTIWERWDSMRPDGSVNVTGMTSFNHYALGAVADWLHKVVAGIDALEPGYRAVLIAPQPGGDLDSAAASLQTPQGPVVSSWTIREDQFELQVATPNGVPTKIILPNGESHATQGGEHTFRAPLT